MIISRFISDGFKVKNPIVEKAFYLVINTFFRNSRKVCKYCQKKMNYNITKL